MVAKIGFAVFAFQLLVNLFIGVHCDGVQQQQHRRRQGGEMKMQWSWPEESFTIKPPPPPPPPLQQQLPKIIPEPVEPLDFRGSSVFNKGFLESDDILLDNVNQCLEHRHLHPEYLHEKNPTLNITIGQNSAYKCIQVFGDEQCRGVSLQFLNVSRKVLQLNKYNSYKRDNLLNFDLCPNSLKNCVPLLENDAKSWPSNNWREHYCKANVQIDMYTWNRKSKSRNKITSGVNDECINIMTPSEPLYSAIDPDLSVFVSRLPEESYKAICLELFTRENCGGEVIRMFIPGDSGSWSVDFEHSLKIWEYFSNTSKVRLIDVDIQSVKKCYHCLHTSPPKSPSKKPSASTGESLPAKTKKPEIQPISRVASFSVDNLTPEGDECAIYYPPTNCTEVCKFLNLSWIDRHLQQNESQNKKSCYIFFNNSNCSGRPSAKDTKPNLNYWDQAISLHVKFASWSVAVLDCGSESDSETQLDIPPYCLPPMDGANLRKIFPIGRYEEFIKDPGTAAPPEESNYRIFIGIVGGVCLILVLVVVIMVAILYRRKRRMRLLRERHGLVKRPDTLALCAQRPLQVHQVDPVDENDYVNDVTGLHALIRCFAAEKYELSRSSINIGNIRDSTAHIIGVGEFSIAFRGILEPSGRTVAVKTMKSGQATARSMKGILKECQVVIMLGKHERIAEFIGICTEDVKKGQLFVVMEYCEKGPLKTFLMQNKSSFVNLVEHEETIPVNKETREEAKRPIQEEPTLKFNTFQLLKWCWEVADAMEFLAVRKIVHVSLSAKNVMLGSDYSSKISDFHLAKIPGENSPIGFANRTNTNKDRLIPWRWFAVESLLDDIFSTQSDAWTFGIFMWEVWTLGHVPYPEYHYGSEFTLCLKHGYRLLKPNYATIECYEMMLMCWYDAPEKRPNFTKIKSRLNDMMTFASQ